MQFIAKPQPKQKRGLGPLRVERCGGKGVHHLRARRYVVAVPNVTASPRPPGAEVGGRRGEGAPEPRTARFRGWDCR